MVPPELQGADQRGHYGDEEDVDHSAHGPDELGKLPLEIAVVAGDDDNRVDEGDDGHDGGRHGHLYDVKVQGPEV